jgi:hypothetical protein
VTVTHTQVVYVDQQLMAESGELLAERDKPENI